MGRTAKFGFPLPGRRTKAPPSPSISGPLSKAQKILGTAEINIDSSHHDHSGSQWDDQQSLSSHHTGESHAVRHIDDGVSERRALNKDAVSIDDEDYTRSRDDGDDDNEVDEEDDGFDSIDEWELESGVIPPHLRAKLLNGGPPGSRAGTALTSDASSTIVGGHRGLSRQSSNTAMGAAYYDKSRVPLSISQQTSASAMAKGLPPKASAILDLDGEIADAGRKRSASGRRKMKPAMLDLSYLIPSRSRWGGASGSSSIRSGDAQSLSGGRDHEPAAMMMGGGAGSGSIRDGVASGHSGSVSKARMVLGPELHIRSPSLLSDTTDLAASLRQRAAGRILGRKRTKESLRPVHEAVNHDSSNGGDAGHMLSAKASDRQLQGLYEHYEQMTFRNVMGIQEEEYESTVPDSAASTSSDSRGTPDRSPTGLGPYPGERNLKQRGGRAVVEQFSPTTTTMTTVTTTTTTTSSSASRWPQSSNREENGNSSTMATTPTALHSQGSSVVSPQAQQYQGGSIRRNHHGQHGQHGHQGHQHGADKDYDASISSRHTRTSRASRHTSQSVFDTNLQQRSVLSLSSDSEGDDEAGSGSGSIRGTDSATATVARQQQQQQQRPPIPASNPSTISVPSTVRTVVTATTGPSSPSVEGTALRMPNIDSVLPQNPQTALPSPPSISERSSSRHQLQQLRQEQYRVSTTRGGGHRSRESTGSLSGARSLSTLRTASMSTMGTFGPNRNSDTISSAQLQLLSGLVTPPLPPMPPLPLSTSASGSGLASRFSIMSTATSASYVTQPGSGPQPNPHRMAMYGIHEARAVTLVQAQPKTRASKVQHEHRRHRTQSSEVSMASVVSSDSTRVASARASSGTAGNSNKNLPSLPTPGSSPTAETPAPDAAANGNQGTGAASQTGPTPPLSPSSVDFYLRSPPADGSGETGLAFMAVTKQEEMLLAALRLKRAKMMRDSAAVGIPLSLSGIVADLAADSEGKTAKNEDDDGEEEELNYHALQREMALLRAVTSAKDQAAALVGSVRPRTSRRESETSSSTATATKHGVGPSSSAVTGATTSSSGVRVAGVARDETRRPGASTSKHSTKEKNHRQAHGSDRRSRSLQTAGETVTESETLTRGHARSDPTGRRPRDREERETRRERVLLYLEQEQSEAMDRDAEDDGMAAMVLPFKLDLDLVHQASSGSSPPSLKKVRSEKPAVVVAGSDRRSQSAATASTASDADTTSTSTRKGRSRGPRTPLAEEVVEDRTAAALVTTLSTSVEDEATGTTPREQPPAGNTRARRGTSPSPTPSSGSRGGEQTTTTPPQMTRPGPSVSNASSTSSSVGAVRRRILELEQSKAADVGTVSAAAVPAVEDKPPAVPPKTILPHVASATTPNGHGQTAVRQKLQAPRSAFSSRNANNASRQAPYGQRHYQATDDVDDAVIDELSTLHSREGGSGVVGTATDSGASNHSSPASKTAGTGSGASNKGSPASKGNGTVTSSGGSRIPVRAHRPSDASTVPAVSARTATATMVEVTAVRPSKTTVRSSSRTRAHNHAEASMTAASAAEGIPRPDSPISPVAPLFQHRFPQQPRRRGASVASGGSGASASRSEDGGDDVRGGKVRLSAVGGLAMA